MVIVVSEETGTISVVMGGEMIGRASTLRTLRVVLRDIMTGERRDLPEAAEVNRIRRTRACRGGTGRLRVVTDGGLRSQRVATLQQPERRGVLMLALAIAGPFYGVSRMAARPDRALPSTFPVELHKLNDGLVVTDQSVDQVNVRVMGSRAALHGMSRRTSSSMQSTSRAGSRASRRTTWT